MASCRDPIAVLGAGSWGTALAVLLANNGQQVTLWGRSVASITTMKQQRCNQRYLPEVVLPPNLMLTADITTALAEVDDILLVVPSTAFAAMLSLIKPLIRPTSRLVWGVKGMDAQAGTLLHVTARRLLGTALPLGILSGPTFAHEVARQLPTAVTLASTVPELGQCMVERLTNHHFRVYTTDDLVGVETCGMVKNILAIAAGLSDGMNLGANARSALITRGLTEITRLGLALGGQLATFMGLAGIGDLVLTCTDNQSRNRRFGLALARGQTLTAIAAEVGEAIEGWYNVASVYQLAQRQGVEMPIVEQIYRIIHEGLTPQAALQNLLAREPKAESSFSF